jgi:hypothetical protein
MTVHIVDYIEAKEDKLGKSTVLSHAESKPAFVLEGDIALSLRVICCKQSPEKCTRIDAVLAYSARCVDAQDIDGGLSLLKALLIPLSYTVLLLADFHVNVQLL